jgi:hypothetical protein
MFDLLPKEIWNGLFVAFRYIYLLAPVWLPALFFVTFFNAWIYYRRSKYLAGLGYVLLEIKLPREILKSPLAMEVVLGVFAQGGGETTWIDRVWSGKVRDWFSLEIVSTEGKIHFYIWTRPKYRNVIETQIYSQYPEVEIYEVTDYTLPFYYDPNKFSIWGCDFILTQPDPFPIKTYVDYGLDKDPKEEFKVDPMAPIIEFLGSITQGQHIWMQILVRAHKKRRFLDLFYEKEDAWKEEAKKQIQDIIAKLKLDKEAGGFPRIPTKGESEVIAALERSVTKIPFDCGIRAVYIAEKDKYNPANIGGITGGWKQYGASNLNGFKPTGWLTIFDYPWQKWFGAEEKLKPILLEEYKMRNYFYSTNQGKAFYSKPFVLNTEELATIFHLPGATLATPTLDRLPSKKSNAPANLPL